MRKETDFIGILEIDENALYGIHALRARMNFPDETAFHSEWYRAMGSVKKACYLTYLKYTRAVRKKYPEITLPHPLIADNIMEALVRAAGEVENGGHFTNFIVPAIQGGAGTSINMNVNEIIANRALQLLQHKTGDYSFIDPIEHSNIFQSTNDVIPTSLKIAILRLLIKLESDINTLRSAMEELEKKARDTLRIAYTQMQEAVPSSYGRLFSTYNDALSRDWWRVSKCSERLRVVNLGGSAVGTAITVPRFFLNEVVQTLQKITALPVSKAENLQDATANLDPLVEVHAIMKAHAVNLEKMVSDIRLLSSDLLRDNEIRIPKLQTGSSIMPGKVNPVIPEFVITAVHRVYTNDQLITNLCAQGCLDLNAYLPGIGHAFIESLKLLIACNESIRSSLVNGLEVNGEKAKDNLLTSPSITTALLPYIGYNSAAALAREMKTFHISILEANKKLKVMEDSRLLQILEPQNLLKEGFTLDSIITNHGERQRE
jgi:aspartate ammonia-lyase